MQRVVLINSRFELLNSPERIDIFDMKDLRRDRKGQVNPILVIHLKEPQTDRDAGKLALRRLLESEKISLGEYLTHMDIFLATVLPDGSANHNRDISPFHSQ
jgi:hypothetical protein